MYIMIITSILYFIIALYSQKRGRTFIGNCILFFPTLIHEFGHVLSTKLLGGYISDVVINLRNSEIKRTSALGWAGTHNKNKLTQSISAFFGYPFPIIMFTLFIILLSNKLTIIWYIIISLIFIYYTFKTSKKSLPLFIVILMGLLIYLTYSGKISNESLQPLILFIPYILNGMLLGETFISMYNMMRLRNKEGYDALVIKNYIHIPQTLTIILWYVIIIISLIVSYIYFNDVNEYNKIILDKFNFIK